MLIFNNYSNSVSIFRASIKRRYSYINGWNKRVRHMSLCCVVEIYRWKLKSTGKSVGFFASLHVKLLNRQSKMSGQSA